MRLLVIHQNFPGQFRHLVQDWARRPGWQVLGIGRDTCPGLPPAAGVRCLRYRPARTLGGATHPYLRKMEDAVLHGQAVLRLLLNLKRRGYSPDVILAHPGWGETLFCREAFPNVRLVHLCEWFYGEQDGNWADVGFDPEFPATLDDHARMRSWNALHLLNLENCDVGICPTEWQRSRHPKAYRHKLTVIHEGVDVDGLGPDPDAAFEVPGKNLTLRAHDPDRPVVTYVARNLEPYRGFHSFMRALEIVQREHPRVHAVIVGGDGVSYGRCPVGFAHWRERMLSECRIDAERTHFVGRIGYEQYKKVLQLSTAHVYLTYPFVLSWSMLEAMATGCFVVGSDTAPVREVLAPGDGGALVDMLDCRAVASGVLSRLMNSESESVDQEVRARPHLNPKFVREFAATGYVRLLSPNEGSISGGKNR